MRIIFSFASWYRFLSAVMLSSFLLLSSFHVTADDDQIQGISERRALEQQVLMSPLSNLNELRNKLSFSKLTIEDQIYLETLIARIHFFKGEIELANDYFDKAQAKLVNGSSNWGTGYFYLYRAFFAIEQGSLDEAKRLIALSRDNFTNIKESNMLARVSAIEGIIHIWREEYAQALATLQDAHAYILKNDVETTTQLVVVDALTAYYATLKYYEKGIELAYQADNLAKNASNILDGLPAKYNLCLILLRKSLLNQAQECYLDMNEVAIEFNLPRYKFWAPSGLGKVAIEQGEYQKALDYFKVAQSFESQAIINPAHLIVLRNNQARALSQLGRHSDADKQVRSALDIVKNYHSPLNNRYLRQTLRLKADILENAGKLKESIGVYHQFIGLLEESELDTKRILEQEAKSFYEAEHHKLRLALSDQKNATQAAELKELQHQKSLTLAYILVFFTTIMSALVFWYFQRQLKLNRLKFFSKDPLTGLYNRLYLHDRLEAMIQEHKPFCIITLDLNDFKRFNDKFGYLVGDEVLRQLANSLRESFRESEDIVVRSGGEEFVILCAQAQANGIGQRLESVRHRLGDKTKQMVDVEVEFSTQVIIYQHQGLTSLLVQIDNALRTSKRKSSS
ncbi:diguanylate cyclase [Pseudoalteromonas luteoviolacea B = ATCC 29581]|nr:diguanylate cyclase [Pseudoalteromonas luteoviolacea B = ATCC 29581]